MTQNTPPPDTTHKKNQEPEERLDPIAIRAQAQALLNEINAEKRRNAPPPALPNNTATPLVNAMRDALTDNNNHDMVTRLKNQADILDTAFRRFISDADTRFEGVQKCEPNLPHYAAAFKAQELFCRTARAIDTLENNKKQSKDCKNDTPP